MSWEYTQTRHIFGQESALWFRRMYERVEDLQTISKMSVKS